MSIRIRNTRTGRTTQARDGKDAAVIAKIELDRRSGIETTGMYPAAPPSLRRHCAQVKAAS
jgi:hypothetical protein